MNKKCIVIDFTPIINLTIARCDNLTTTKKLSRVHVNIFAIPVKQQFIKNTHVQNINIFNRVIMRLLVRKYYSLDLYEFIEYVNVSKFLKNAIYKVNFNSQEIKLLGISYKPSKLAGICK